MASTNSLSGSLSFRQIWEVLAEPWRRLHRVPALAFLMPQPVVRLLQADGSVSFWKGARPLPPGTKPLGSSFTAIEVPEASVLRRPMRLPKLPDADLQRAIELEVRTSSPFSPAELLWGYVVEGGGPQHVAVRLVSTSRRLVQAALQQYEQQLPAGAVPEVWVREGQTLPIVIQGFGEGRRLAQASRGRGLTYALAGTALLLLVAVAVTPSVQLKLRGMQAVKAYVQAERQSAPLLRQREVLGRAADDVRAVRDLMADHIDPLMVIELVTNVAPDDTYLQRLQVVGGRVTIAGQAPDAAAFMNVLSSHPYIRDVRAPQAASRATGMPKENFVIEFQLAPHAMRPFVAPPPSAAASAVPVAAAPARPSSAAAVPVPATAASAPAKAASSPAPKAQP